MHYLSKAALGALSNADPDIEEPRHSLSSDAEVCLGADSARIQRPSVAEATKQPASPFTDLEALKKVEVEKVAVLSFRSLQLDRIAEMQDDLLVLALAGARGETQDKDKIDKALRTYADALRNYETLSLHAQSQVPTGVRLVGKLALGVVGAEPHRSTLKEIIVPASERVFLGNPTTERVPRDIRRRERSALFLSDSGIPPSELLKYMEKTVGNLGFRELDQKGREERSRKQAFTQRIVMALFGGAAVIGPMLVMTLHPSRNTSLITVSLATFLFALLLAIVAKDSAGKDVLAATAAYAAVLVVFVGTSMAPSS